MAWPPNRNTKTEGTRVPRKYPEYGRGTPGVCRQQEALAPPSLTLEHRREAILPYADDKLIMKMHFIQQGTRT